MEKEFERVAKAEDNNPLAASWRKRCEELEAELQETRWRKSIDEMPPYDGEYYVCGWLYHECGNVTKIHKIATCSMNKWIKADGEQYTFWRPLLLFPS